jgi:hypothetical protein
MKKYGMDRVFALSALCVALVGCSGGSNNLNNPSSANKVSPCSGSDCVPFEFTDDPVVGLNYTCGTVQNVTDATGLGYCPNDTDVTLYLKAAQGTRRVILGKMHVNAIRASDEDESSGGNAPLLRITPRDLVPSPTTLTTLDDNSVSAKVAINITRLLHALRERKKDSNNNIMAEELEPYINSAPVNRIVIKDELKVGIDKLTEDFVATDFGLDTLETKLAPWLTASNLQLIPVDTAKSRLMKTLQGLKAGLYTGSPAVSTPNVGTSAGSTVINGTVFNTSTLGLGVEGVETNDNTKRTTMAIYMKTDRSGATIGQGLKWSGTATTSETAYSLYLKENFVKMRPVSPEAGFNPVTNYVKSLKWVTEASSTIPSQTIDMYQGLLVRNFVMAGSDPLYRRYTSLKDGVALPDKAIGTWVQPEAQSADGQLITKEHRGTATLTKGSSVNTFLDRTAWRTKDTVTFGSTYVFPLHATFTFTYGAGTVGCDTTGCTDLPSLGVTILENGDIITDRSANTVDSEANCSPVTDMTTLKDATGVQEYRIGTVRAAYPIVANGNQLFISPMIVLSGAQFGALDGIQIGTVVLAPRVKLNVTPLASAIAGQVETPLLVVTNASTEAASATGTADAVWANVYNAFLTVKTDPTDAQKALAKKAQGVLKAAVSPCFSIQTKS